MRDESSLFGTKNQVIDFANCASIPIPGSGIQLLIPSKEASKQLGAQLDMPARLVFVRQLALQGIEDQEVFVQKCFAVGRTQTGLLVVLVISILADRTRWRGGWIVFLTTPGEEGKLQEYLRTARNDVVANLRAERTSGGSFS
jgi:hypothetical protein